MKKIFVLAALFVAACSCSKEVIETPFNPDELEFTNTLTLNGQKYQIAEDDVTFEIFYYDTDYTDELGFTEPVYCISGYTKVPSDKSGLYQRVGFALFLPVDNTNKLVNLKNDTGGIYFIDTNVDVYKDLSFETTQLNSVNYSSGYFKSNSITIAGTNFNNFYFNGRYCEVEFESYTKCSEPNTAKYYFVEYPRIELCQFCVWYKDASGNSLEISYRGYPYYYNF